MRDLQGFSDFDSAAPFTPNARISGDSGTSRQEMPRFARHFQPANLSRSRSPALTVRPLSSPFSEEIVEVQIPAGHEHID
jgi:hypothetical protein